MGHLWTTCSHENGIEGRFLWPAEGAVAVPGHDVVVSKLLEAVTGSLQQAGMPLDGVHLICKQARAAAA